MRAPSCPFPHTHLKPDSLPFPPPQLPFAPPLTLLSGFLGRYISGIGAYLAFPYRPTTKPPKPSRNWPLNCTKSRRVCLLLPSHLIIAVTRVYARLTEHDSAVSKEHATAQDIATKTNEHHRITQEFERKKAALNDIQHKVGFHSPFSSTTPSSCSNSITFSSSFLFPFPILLPCLPTSQMHPLAVA